MTYLCHCCYTGITHTTYWFKRGVDLCR